MMLIHCLRRLENSILTRTENMARNRQTKTNKQEKIHTSFNNIEYQRINKVSAFSIILELNHKD